MAVAWSEFAAGIRDLSHPPAGAAAGFDGAFSDEENPDGSALLKARACHGRAIAKNRSVGVG